MTTENKSTTFETGGTVDFRVERLRTQWADLKRSITPDSAILWSAEWAALEAELGGPVPEAPVAVLPPAIPEKFPDDPKNVLRAVVWRKAFNVKLWLVRIELHSGQVEADLWVRPGLLLKPGWRVYVRPNADPGQGGYVLHGEYNRYGERLR